MSNLEYLENKRLQIIDLIQPMCSAFGIKDYDYKINKETLAETLIIDNQKIGCSCNSINAVVEEVIGYIFIKNYSRWWYHKPQTVKAIKQYWID